MICPASVHRPDSASPAPTTLGFQRAEKLASQVQNLLITKHGTRHRIPEYSQNNTQLACRATILTRRRWLRAMPVSYSAHSSKCPNRWDVGGALQTDLLF